MSDYKNFKQIADMATNGNSAFHRVEYKHPEEECMGWQRGIHNLANWLDKNGFMVVEIPKNTGCRVGLGKFLILLGELVAGFGNR